MIKPPQALITPLPPHPSQKPPSSPGGRPSFGGGRGNPHPPPPCPSLAPAPLTTLTKPSFSPRMLALLLAANGNLPTRTSYPQTRAFASVRPTLATSGAQ